MSNAIKAFPSYAVASPQMLKVLTFWAKKITSVEFVLEDKVNFVFKVDTCYYMQIFFALCDVPNYMIGIDI